MLPREKLPDIRNQRWDNKKSSCLRRRHQHTQHTQQPHRNRRQSHSHHTLDQPRRG